MSRFAGTLKRPSFNQALLLVGLALSGCQKREPIPTERMLVVKAPVAPGMDLLDPRRIANRKVHQGEVFGQRARHPDFKWAGTMDGEPVQRVGAIEVTRSAAEGAFIVFASDLMEADIPTSGWLCSKMGSPAESGTSCPQVLRRTVVPGGKLVSYVPCVTPACPIAELDAGRVTTSSLPTLSELRVVNLNQRPAILAWSRWLRAPEWTGSRLIVMLVTPPLQKAGEIALDEIDARDPVLVSQRAGELQILDNELRFTGKKALVERDTDKERSATPIEEHYRINSGGELVKD